MRYLVSKLFCAAIVFAGTVYASVEDAQKAYVSGNFSAAADAFDTSCPALEASKRPECALWGVLARSQTGNAKDFSRAKKKLDSLILATPDSLPVLSDLYMTRAQFELYLKRPDLSFHSLGIAFAKAEKRQLGVIFQVCQSLYKANPMDSVQSLCAEIQRARSAAPEASSSSAGSISPGENDSTPSAKSSASEVSDSSTVPLETAAPSSPSAESWSLQVGAFGISSNAEMLANSLKAKKIDVRVVESASGDRTLHLVQVGNFETREQALEYGKTALDSLHLEFRPVKKQESF